MDEVSKIRLRRRVLTVALLSALVVLIVYGVVKPAPEEKEFERLKDAFTSGDPGKMNQEAREELRKVFERLSPETRKKLTREILREQIRRSREMLAQTPEEEKIAKVEEAVLRIRKDFKERMAKMSPEDKERMKTEMSSEKSRETIDDAMKFYAEELTAKERQLLDPLINEVINNLNTIYYQ